MVREEETGAKWTREITKAERGFTLSPTSFHNFVIKYKILQQLLKLIFVSNQEIAP